MGRKTLIMINLLILLVGFLLIVFSQNIWMAGVGLFLCVFGGKNNFNLVMMFTAETVGERFRQVFMMVILTMYSLGGLANVLWYYFLPNF